MKIISKLNKSICLWGTILFLFTQSSYAQKSELALKIDKLMIENYSSAKPGAAILVAQSDHVIIRKGYGKASLSAGKDITPQSVFRIGSLTKQFTAVAILKLIKEDKLSLQDKIIKYLPEYKPQGELVTIENLLNHTSGITDYTGILNLRSAENKAAPKTIQQRFNDFSSVPLEFTPGEKYKYSNSGFFILGMIIEKVSGISYGEYIEKNLFTPLKMKSSYYDGAKKSIPNKAVGYNQTEKGFEEAAHVDSSMPFAAGAIGTTVEDLWKWNQAVFKYQVLPKSILEKAWQSTTLTNGIKVSYGYGWSLARIDNLKVIEHGGGIDGYLSYILYVPEEKVFITILTNSTYNNCLNLIYDIARLVLNHPIKNPDIISMSEQQLDEYTGSYLINNTNLRVISRQGNQLFAQDGYAEKVEIYPFKKDGFFITNSPDRFEFYRDQNNQFSTLLFSGSGWENQTGIRTNESTPIQKIAINMESAKFDEYVGVYEIAPGFNLKVWREGKIFMAEATGQGAYEIHPETETKFFIREVDAALEFLKEDKKDVTAVIVRLGKNSSKGIKLK
jgi:CubicO group peptidase (beta-lactamase class C family)